MTNTSLIELLRGMKIIRDRNGNVVVQSIRNMDIVFLTTESDDYSRDGDFGNPIKDLAVSNQHYGHINLRNDTDTNIIVAPQAAFITKSASQNHALPKSGFVPAMRAVDYNDAGCVQGSQSGYIRGDAEIRFMPISIREMLLKEVNKTEEYSHLYRAVNVLGVKTQANTGNYVDKYYTKYDRTLQEFIAHFERPAKCIGVVIFIDDEIVAVDKFPSYRYMRQVWDLLVRDCYGSLAIESMVNNYNHRKEFTELYTSTLHDTESTTIERMLATLSAMEFKRSNRFVDRLQELLEVEFTKKKDDNALDGVFESFVLESEGYIGQVISTAGYHHVISLIKKEKFKPDTLRAAREYRQLAAQQRDFTI